MLLFKNFLNVPLLYNATAELFTEFNFCVLHLEVAGVKFVIYFELKRVLFNFFSGGGGGGRGEA